MENSAIHQNRKHVEATIITARAAITMYKVCIIMKMYPQEFNDRLFRTLQIMRDSISVLSETIGMDEKVSLKMEVSDELPLRVASFIEFHHKKPDSDLMCLVENKHMTISLLDRIRAMTEDEYQEWLKNNVS